VNDKPLIRQTIVGTYSKRVIIIQKIHTHTRC
jgi:hypothetical protein